MLVAAVGAAVDGQQPLLDPFGQRREVGGGGLGEVEQLAFDGGAGELLELFVADQAVEHRGGGLGGAFAQRFLGGLLEHRFQAGQVGLECGQVRIHGFRLGEVVAVVAVAVRGGVGLS